MKQLITLSILLLAGPSLVSAQPSQNFNVTSGSMHHIFNSDFPYTIAGLGFSAAGDIQPEFPTDFDEPVGPGTFHFLVDGNTDQLELADVSLTVHGVPWSFPDNTEGMGGGALAAFDSTVSFGAHPGTYHSTFNFFENFAGGPEVGDVCTPTTCLGVHIVGSGTATWDLIPNPNITGAFDISQVTFTFKAPEPSTTSLLLLGVAGLAVLGRRRRSRVTLLPTS